MPKFKKHGIEWVTADEDLESETPRYLMGTRKSGSGVKKKAGFSAKKAMKKAMRGHTARVVRAKKAVR